MARNPGTGAEAAAIARAFPAGAAAAERRLVALTRDAALNQTLEELAAGSECDVLVVEDLRTLSDELLQQRCTVALLDAMSLDAPVDAVVDALATQFPDLRLLVSGHVAEQNLLASRIASQTVFRFVHKPVSAQRLRLFLDAALSQSPRRAESTPPAAAAAGAAGRSGIGRARHLAIAAAAAALVAALYLLWPGPGEPPAPAATSAPATPAAAAVPALLERADAAFADKHFVASDGTSAAELYRDALRIEPSNAAAVAGFPRAIDSGLRAAEEALLGGRLEAAAMLAETVRLIDADNPRLAFLNTQIAREMARASADASQRQNLEARREQIRTALALMQESQQRGALIEPATSSALAHVREAEAVGAGDPAVRTAREALVAALLTAADRELGAGHVAAARNLVDTAASVNSSAPGLDVLRRRVDEVAAEAARTREPPPAVVAPPQASPGAAPAPPPAAPALMPVAPAPPTEASVVRSAPATPAAVAPAAAGEPEAAVVSASTLRLLRQAEPVYPARALDNLVSGWVDLEFTVQPDGSVDDIVVTRAEPARTFDAAAIAALRRYRYAPVVRDGTPVTQRARLRIRFTAADR